MSPRTACGCASRSATLAAQLAKAKALVAAADTRIASLQHSAERGASAMAVLTAPDLARMDRSDSPTRQTRAPAPSAPRARNRLQRVESTATAPARPARYGSSPPTQTGSGAHLIEPNPQGHVDVVFATPPDIAQPKAVAVTLDKTSSVLARRGAKYLVGFV